VLGLEGGQAEVNRAQGAQHEPLDAVEVVQAEGQRGGSGLRQSFAWVVEIEPVKPAQSARPVTRLHQCAQLRDGITGTTKYELLGQERRRCAGFASGCSVLGIGYARSLSILDATVFGYLVFAIEEDDAVFVGAHFEPSAETCRWCRVAVGVQGDVAFQVDDALVERVHLGDVDRQWSQRRPFGGPSLDGSSLQAFAKLAVLAFAPRARLLM